MRTIFLSTYISNKEYQSLIMTWLIYYLEMMLNSLTRVIIIRQHLLEGWLHLTKTAPHIQRGAMSNEAISRINSHYHISSSFSWTR